MRLIEFIFDAIFNVFDAFLEVMMRWLDLMILGMDKIILGFDYLFGGVEKIIDALITVGGRAIDEISPCVHRYLIIPAAFAIYWCICKVRPYELVVLLRYDDTLILALAKTDNIYQYCTLKVRHKKLKYWLEPNGSVVDDGDTNPPAFIGYIKAWLPKTDRDKRLFMILSGARPFIT